MKIEVWIIEGSRYIQGWVLWRETDWQMWRRELKGGRIHKTHRLVGLIVRSM